MKNKYFLFAICLTVLISGCSKKNISSTNNDLNKQYSQQLEMDYPVTADASVTAEPAEGTYKYSGLIANTKSIDARYESRVTSARKEIIVAKKANAIAKIMEAKSSGKRFVERMSAKSMKKVLNKQEKQDGQVSGGGLIAGIIVGLIGLGLIAIAGATGAASLVYIGGVVLFVAGIILILVSVF